METTILFVFDGIGVVLSTLFVIMMIRGMRSLQGSFFKDYYRAMVVAAVALLFGFMIDPAGIYVFHLTEFVAQQWHHIGLIVASILFVYAGYLLPKDAAQYMESQHSDKQ